MQLQLQTKYFQVIILHVLTSCNLQFKQCHQTRMVACRVIWVTLFHLRNEKTQPTVLTKYWSKHNAGTISDHHFTSVCTKLELSELYQHHLRQMPHSINTGTWADCQMSQSHTNKPELGLLNRVKESKGEAYMYVVYQDLCSTHSCFWKNFKFLGIKMLW